MSNPFILDTETAGLQGGVCELAFLRVDDDLNILEEFCVRVNPERPIHPQASAIHGISDADVADCPTLAQVTAGIPRFADPIIYVGHNCSFDQRMTDPFIRPSKSMCTLALSREHIKGTTNNKLATLQLELGLPVQKSHSALGDVHTTRDLILHVMAITGADFKTLLERADKPKLMARMPFGEHKGKTILQTPKAYRDWMLAQSDIPKDLRFTLEKFRNV